MYLLVPLCLSGDLCLVALEGAGPNCGRFSLVLFSNKHGVGSWKDKLPSAPLLSNWMQTNSQTHLPPAQIVTIRGY